jgi:hypothetical protein
MLLNFSNHPSAEWSEEQYSTAQSLFGSILDIPFPVVDPHATTEHIVSVAKESLHHILQHKPQAVHIMGEMTLVVAVVGLLQQAGVMCVASTTKRSVTELPTGEKQSWFEFVQFRAYPLLFADKRSLL